MFMIFIIVKPEYQMWLPRMLCHH